MSTILVVDDRAIFREPIAVCLRQKGYTTYSADNGRIGLELMKKHHPDLILLDVAMPEVNGIQFLHAMRDDPEHQSTPVILLTAVAERNYVVEAARLGVKDYMLKSSFSLEEMLVRVRARLAPDGKEEHGAPNGDSPARDDAPAASRADAAAPSAEKTNPGKPNPPARSDSGAAPAALRDTLDLQPIIAREELIRLVNKGLELKPLAPIVQTVMAATSNASCSAEDVAQAVSQDQALSIRILKLANASTYSRGRPMQNLKDAIGRIGTREVRHLVMTLGVLEAYEGSISEHMDARLFWEHSVGCGQIASALSRACGRRETEDLFLPATLHDVGRLVLCEHVGDKYAKVFEIARERKLPLELVESKLMLLDHCNILERALDHWHFPREFITPVVSHHQNPQALARLGPAQTKPSCIIALANRLAHALLLGTSGNDIIYPINELMATLGIEPETLTQLLDQIPSSTDFLKVSVQSRVHEQRWPSMAEKVTAALQQPVRALCLSDTPGQDPYPILFGRLNDKTAASPNLVVLHLSDVRNQGRFDKELESKAAGSDPLPIIVICQRGQIDVSQGRIHHHPFRVLRSPVRLESLIAAINELLDV